MLKNGLTPVALDLSDRPEDVIRDLINRSGGKNVAGQVRYQHRNYRLLSQFVGTAEIRRLFDTAS